MKKRLQAWGNDKIIHIACCFVFNQDGEILLLQRHAADLGGGQWSNPGGRIEKDEQPRATVIREIKEETGLSVGMVHQLGAHHLKMPHGTVHMTSFKAVIPKATTIRLDPEEHNDHRWFSLDCLLQQENIIWGLPSVLRDFDLMPYFKIDPTLVDGSQAILEERL